MLREILITRLSHYLADLLDNFPIYIECQARVSQHRFWHCNENGLVMTFQAITHNLYVSFKLASLYCGLRIILVYPNP